MDELGNLIRYKMTRILSGPEVQDLNPDVIESVSSGVSEHESDYTADSGQSKVSYISSNDEVDYQLAHKYCEDIVFMTDEQQVVIEASKKDDLELGAGSNGQFVESNAEEVVSRGQSGSMSGIVSKEVDMMATDDLQTARAKNKYACGEISSGEISSGGVASRSGPSAELSKAKELGICMAEDPKTGFGLLSGVNLNSTMPGSPAVPAGCQEQGIESKLREMELGAVSSRGDLATGIAMEEDLQGGYQAPPGEESC